jgi:FMN phosphatase YigB (HAD superfamily)
MKHVVFDWGDTLMKDDPTREDAMCLWPEVELVPGADLVLQRLSQQHQISLATSASKSDHVMIRRALARVALNEYVSEIFTGRDAGAKKTDPVFWRHVLNALKADVSSVYVIGDGFEGDVLTPSSIGIQSFWLNRLSSLDRIGPGYRTIFELQELIPIFG